MVTTLWRLIIRERPAVTGGNRPGPVGTKQGSIKGFGFEGSVVKVVVASIPFSLYLPRWMSLARAPGATYHVDGMTHEQMLDQ